MAAIIVLLSLAIGILHFALDFVLFRGRIFSTPGPPPGAPPPAAANARPPGGGPPGLPFGVQLPQAFLINLILFIVLAIVFLAVMRARPLLRGIVDVILLLASAGTLWGWNLFRRPNPQGLGTWAVTMEIALIIFALAHVLTLTRRASTAAG